MNNGNEMYNYNIHNDFDVKYNINKKDVEIILRV